MKSGRIIGIVIAGLAIGFASQSNAQNFRESEDLWKTETIREHNMDTVRVELHSFFSLPALADTTQLIYHEPMPDSVMPKSSIEVGRILVQATSAEDVLSMLEKEARKIGADWIVSFNEPRLKFTSKGQPYYRSEAMLYKVLNPELVSQSDIAEINCTRGHLKTCAAVQDFILHAAKTGE